MKRWIGIRASGEAIRDTVSDTEPVQEGVLFFPVEQDSQVNIVTQYWDGEGFTERGPKPEHHAFDYQIKQWVPDVMAASKAVKQQRDRLLSGTDWQVAKAVETGKGVPRDWVTYRQALRDVTLQPDYPFTVLWPVQPAN